MAKLYIKFLFYFCWLLTSVDRVNSVNKMDDSSLPLLGDIEGQQQDVASSSTKFEEKFILTDTIKKHILNGETTDQPPPSVKNTYPLSANQRILNGLTQQTMMARVSAQLAAGKADNSKFYHQKLQNIVRDHVFGWLFSFENLTVNSLSDTLIYLIDSKIKNTVSLHLTYGMDLMEILITTSNAQKEEMGLFSTDTCVRMREHPSLKKDFPYRTMLWHLCRERRDESFDYDEAKAAQMANKIGEYLKMEEQSKWWTMHSDPKVEIVIAEFLAKTNYTQLRLTLEQQFDGISLRKRLENVIRTVKKSSDFYQVFDFMLTDVLLGRPHFFARLLESRLHNMIGVDGQTPYDHQVIARILLSRARIDLLDIADAFPQFHYGKGKEHYRSAIGLLDTLKLVNDNVPWEKASSGMSYFFCEIDTNTLEGFIKIVTLVKQPGWLDDATAN